MSGQFGRDPQGKNPMTELIDPTDLHITIRDPTPGGQRVGTTPWVMRVTHTPSGLSVEIAHTVERSQHRARQIAISMLEGGLTCPAFRKGA